MAVDGEKPMALDIEGLPPQRSPRVPPSVDLPPREPSRTGHHQRPRATAGPPGSQHEELRACLGSLTARGPPATRIAPPTAWPSASVEGVGTPNQNLRGSIACLHDPYRRFAAPSRDTDARLRAIVCRYHFDVENLHLLLHAGCPALSDGAHPDHVTSEAGVCRSTTASPYTTLQHPIQRGCALRGINEGSSNSPYSGLPLACGRPDGTGRPWALPRASYPADQEPDDARRGGDRPSSTSLELLAQHHISRSPIQ